MRRQSYTYLAYEASGRRVEGLEEAASRQELAALLAERGLIPVRIEPAKTAGRWSLPVFGRGGGSRELVAFTEGLATLVAAHVPLDKALVMLEELAEDPRFRGVVRSLGRELGAGASLHAAMELHPRYFSPLYRSMIRAGEEGGILEVLLPRLLLFLKEAAVTRGRLISALIYPAILALVGLLSVGLLLVFVVPKFAAIFEGSGSPIPASAAFLLALGGLLRAWGWLFLLLPPLLWYGWSWLAADPARVMERDRRLLRLPLLGGPLLFLESASFARTLSTLLLAGVPLIRALRTARGVVGNRFLAGLLEEVEGEVREGRSLGRALDGRAGFPKLLSRLVMVGEESGETAAVLGRVGEHFDHQARERIDRLVALLEPVLILALGLFIGGIVLVMLSAVFSLNDAGL